MGAGAGKEANPSDDTSSDIRITAVEMSCESCSVNFTILKRKKSCFDCGKNHCSNCMTKPPTGKSSQRRCKRCQLLTSGNFTRNDLMDVPTKELRSFILRRKIPMNNCTEKSDLVDILLSTSNNSHYMKELAEKQRHLVELEERKRRRDVESAVWRSAQPGDATTAGEESVQTDPQSAQIGPESEETDSSVNRAQTTTTGLSVDNESNSSVNSSDPPATTDLADNPMTIDMDSVPSAHTDLPHTEEGINSSLATEPATADASISTEQTQNMESNQCTEDSPKQPGRKITHLQDMKEAGEIEDLSVRQLKEVLATSYVHYKGCCEKWELVERVTRLFHEKQKNKERAEELENADDMSGESELCKICMDAVIDCVLLDCGHMVTCTQCGKQMAECPMCRQYVVRVVHVFKA